MTCAASSFLLYPSFLRVNEMFSVIYMCIYIYIYIYYIVSICPLLVSINNSERKRTFFFFFLLPDLESSTEVERIFVNNLHDTKFDLNS